MQADATTDAEALVGEQRAIRPLPLRHAERRAEALATAVFLVLAGWLAATGWSDTSWDSVAALVLVLSYAGATRARFETGLLSTDVSLLVFVPMLFVLPAEVVPLACATGLLLGRLPDYVRGRVHPSKALAIGGNSIHALGPAAVLAAGVDGGPRWGDWPLYLAAFGAYVLCDVVALLGREWIARGERPAPTLGLLWEIYSLDALLAPMGLMAAFATEEAGYAFLLGAPLVLVLNAHARDRAERLGRELELSESRRALLEAELAATRSREEVLATVSHGLQTPLATVVGLTELLAVRGEQLPPTRRAEAVLRLRVEAEALRQLVRQALDFVALRAGRELRVAPEDVDVLTLAREIPGVAVDPDAPDAPVVAHADRGRVRQVLLALAAAGDGAIRVLADEDGGVRMVVAGRGPAPSSAEAPFAEPQSAGDEAGGPGIDLVVARALCRAMGGGLTAERVGAGWTLEARLPAGAAVGSAGPG